jgi:hypothetical protein
MTRHGKRWTPTERQSVRTAWYDEFWEVEHIAEVMRRKVSAIEHEARRQCLPPKTARFYSAAQRFAQAFR